MIKPFSLHGIDQTDYLDWREAKLALYPKNISELLVNVANPMQLTKAEHQAILEKCTRANMVVYQLTDQDLDYEDKKIILALAAQIGLNLLDTNICADEDSITSIQVKEDGKQIGYIPYSNKKLSWHTDGYYNSPQNQINGMALHCVHPAASGGINQLLDHEMLYIHLRETNPGYISALMHPEAMTIPANNEEGDLYRDAQTGPVFSVQPQSGALHMRYSARKRNIIWREDALTMDAVAEIENFLNGNNEWIFYHQLQAGQGILCNNVLHNRTAFENDEHAAARLIYRGRYYDRISHTTPQDLMRLQKTGMI